MTPVQQYYVQNVMPRVNQMLLGVIGIGVLTLSVKYVYLITEQPGIVLNENFWKRIVLLGLIIAFAAYNALVYYAYAHVEQEHVARADRPMRIFVLFLFDVAQITFSACMFGTMYIENPGDLLATPECQVSLAHPQCLDIGWHSFVMVFAFAGLWHIAVVSWYVVADRLRWRDIWRHGAFALVYLAIVLANIFIGFAGDWWAIATFAVTVLFVYLVQGSHWLGPAPQEQTNSSTDTAQA